MTRILPKPKLVPKDYLVKLEAEIFGKTAELEDLDAVFAEKTKRLTDELDSLQGQRQKELSVLENTLNLLRQEEIQLNKPIEHKRQELLERENRLIEREKGCDEREQTVFEREREVESKLESLQDLADSLGEKKQELLSKENSLKELESTLKVRETQYLLKIDKFSHEVNISAALIQERENEVLVKELAIDAKEENLAKREQKLIQDKLLVQSQRQALLAAQK